MTGTTVQAPGKLFVAGEYAVVDGGNSAILVAVDRFVTVTVASTRDGSTPVAGSITSEVTQGRRVHWHLRDGSAVVEGPYAKPTQYVCAALSVVTRYLAELHCAAGTLDLTVTSTMTNRSGIKLGLGSSGAVTVATIAAVLHDHGIHATARQVYRLAMLATTLVDPSASGGDLAVAAYGGWILYRSPDRQALRNAYQAGTSIQRIIEGDWPDHEIVRLPALSGLTLQVGWVGSPASTIDQVRQLQDIDTAHQMYDELQGFHWASGCLVRTMAKALLNDDHPSFMRAIKGTRLLLGSLEHWSGICIETPELRTLCESAKAIGAVAKTSGAGGGDCGIAFVSCGEEQSRLRVAWRDHAIEPLDLNPYNRPIEVNYDSAR